MGRPVFRVHQRKVQEHPLDRPELAILRTLQRPLGGGPGFRVPSERPARVAEQHPRELIEDDDLGEGSARGLLPVVVCAIGHFGVQTCELRAHLRVDRRLSPPPAEEVRVVVAQRPGVVPVAEPEVQHVVRAHGAGMWTGTSVVLFV